MKEKGDVKKLSSELNTIEIFFFSSPQKRSCCAVTKDNLHHSSECHALNLQNRNRNIDSTSYLSGTALVTDELKEWL